MKVYVVIEDIADYDASYTKILKVFQDEEKAKELVNELTNMLETLQTKLEGKKEWEDGYYEECVRIGKLMSALTEDDNESVADGGSFYYEEYELE